MKHGKLPTVRQRKLMSEWSLRWQDWLVVKNLPNSMIVRHRYTSEVRIIEKAAR